ncbi:hypothetical protein [Streptomyces sp. NK08204]|uniref:hypothetical protein n=1 Tax=Streptomyces sp. NK08204 TaxID=2873260 RepID=UPI001CECBFBE|nr:hypothetical protein [Streptomyces sp. NK08204]
MTLLALGIGVTPALAANPHFIGEPTCSKTVINDRATVTCSGKAAGLGTSPARVFLTADQIAAQYVCVNPGGNTAPGKPAFFQLLTGPVQNITPHAGQITFSVSMTSPPNPSPSQVCPNGNWTVHLISVTFHNLTLHIQQPAGTDVLIWNFGDVDPR